MMNISPEMLKDILSKTPLYRVESSNIIAIGYNKNLRILRILFNNFSGYLYFNVEPEIYARICSAESKGKILHETIIRDKDKYQFIRIQ